MRSVRKAKVLTPLQNPANDAEPKPPPKPTGIPVHLVDVTTDNKLNHDSRALCAIKVRTLTLFDHHSPDACSKCKAIWQESRENNLQRGARFNGALA